MGLINLKKRKKRRDIHVLQEFLKIRFKVVFFFLKSKNNNLYDMVLEADVFFLLSGSVLNIKNTDEIRSPAPEYTIENLKKNS